jgi:hypothetical protein
MKVIYTGDETTLYYRHQYLRQGEAIEVEDEEGEGLIASGAWVEEGEYEPPELEEPAEEPAEEQQLTGDALDARAAELEIEGRSSMTADEKRAAIAEAEAELEEG